MRVGASAVIAMFAMAAQVAPAHSDAQTNARADAAELYRSAEVAMAEGRWADAVRDYGAAYELTKDAVLFYKLGSAYARAGNCVVAGSYFARYLREGKPADVSRYADEAKKRLAECYATTGTTPPTPKAADPASPPHEPNPVPPPAPIPTVSPVPPQATIEVNPEPPKPTDPPHAHGSRAAWLAVGGAVTFATIGAVLAYAARSSEVDISDLYVGLRGKPPTFDAATAARYTDLVDEGNRYKHLSWAAFGLGGVSAIATTILFARGSGDEVIVAPTSTGATVSAAFRF